MTMRLEYFDAVTSDFERLTRELDSELAERNGEKQGLYAPYNKLSGIHDIVIAFDGDAAIGCGSMKRYDDSTFEVKRVFVERPYRGSGVAKAIIREIEAAARRKGIERLILETGKTMAEANGLYRGLGYRVIENYGQYEGMDFSVCMEKRLVEGRSVHKSL